MVEDLTIHIQDQTSYKDTPNLPLVRLTRDGVDLDVPQWVVWGLYLLRAVGVETSTKLIVRASERLSHLKGPKDKALGFVAQASCVSASYLRDARKYLLRFNWGAKLWGPVGLGGHIHPPIPSLTQIPINLTWDHTLLTGITTYIHITHLDGPKLVPIPRRQHLHTRFGRPTKRYSKPA